MKKGLIGVTAFVAALTQGSPTLAVANSNPLCTDKESEVRQQMEIARQRDNQERLRGLENALDSIRRHCTDEALRAEAEEEVRDSQADLEEQRQELEEAIREGDTDKIEDRQQDLREATEELEEHIRELEALRSRAAR